MYQKKHFAVWRFKASSAQKESTFKKAVQINACFFKSTAALKFIDMVAGHQPADFFAQQGLLTQQDPLGAFRPSLDS